MITIRPTTHQDASVLAAIQQQAFRPLYVRYHDEGNPCLRGPEDITRRLDTPVFRYFTIEEDGEILGGVLYKCSGRIPSKAQLEEGECYLQRVYIRPERQGQKIAQTAIRLCEESMPEFHTFYVDFPEDLEKNRRCYEAAGYRDTGERLPPLQPGLVLACLKRVR